MPYPGRNWTPFPPTTLKKQLNIVDGDRTVFMRILDFVLLRKGEDPLHPEMGVAVQLFEPLSSTPANFIVYHLKSELIKWNEWAAIGIKDLEVSVNDQQIYTNSLEIRIGFSTIATGQATILTFGYYQYTNAILSNDFPPFLDSAAINGVRLREWKY